MKADNQIAPIMKAKTALLIKNRGQLLAHTLVILAVLSHLNCSAAALVVRNTSNDEPNSLRDAIYNALDGDTIIFIPGLTGTITLTSGALGISNSITIQGPGANKLTIDGNASDRVFFTEAPLTGGGIAELTVAISGLTISHGFSTSYGGGIYNDPFCTLTLSNCWVVNNTAGGDGGGIDSDGPLVLVGCTISGNKAIGDGVGGGGIAGDCPYTISLTNCTVTANAVNGGGGGLKVESGSLNHCTISGNSALSQISGHQPGGIDCENDCLLWNTIVAENNGGPPDLYTEGGNGGFTSLGFNLIGSDVPSVGWLASDLTSTDPKLGPLKYNGGPTPTMMPAPNSDAVDWGSSGGLSTDQRGLPRPSPFVLFGPYLPPGGDGSDIGAVELQPIRYFRIDGPGVAVLPRSLLVSWQADPGMLVHVVQTPDMALGPGNWVTSNLPVMTINGTNGVVINEPKGNMFFRLKLQ